MMKRNSGLSFPMIEALLIAYKGGGMLHRWPDGAWLTWPKGGKPPEGAPLPEASSSALAGLERRGLIEATLTRRATGHRWNASVVMLTEEGKRIANTLAAGMASLDLTVGNLRQKVAEKFPDPRRVTAHGD